MSAGRRAFLDLRPVDMSAFPNIVERLGGAGIDPRRELVPVAPAAHYMIGGVVTDEHGRSTLRGLYAVGECACTGVHGANRLASNSLSECFVFGRRAALCAVEEPVPAPSRPTACHRPACPAERGDPCGPVARCGPRTGRGRARAAWRPIRTRWRG